MNLVLWLLQFHLDLELLPLHSCMRSGAVATTVGYELKAVVANTPFGFNALAATDPFDFRNCGHYRSM